MARVLFLLVLLGSLPGLAGCGEPVAGTFKLDTRPVLNFGFLPYADRARMKELFDGISGHLSEHLKMEVRFVLSPDYETIGQLLAQRKIDLVWFTPASYANIGRKYGAKIICKPFRRNNASYRPVFMVLKNSKYKTLADLKGCRFAYVDRNSTSGFIVPNRMLKKAGFPDPLEFFSSVDFTNGHTSSLMGVFEGRYDAAAVFETAQRTVVPPATSEDFRELVLGPDIPNDPICARADLSPELMAKLLQLFMEMESYESGKAALSRLDKAEQIKRFVAARDEEYTF